MNVIDYLSKDVIINIINNLLSRKVFLGYCGRNDSLTE